MSQKIWVTGDAVVDLIPDGENHYLRCAGGAPANVAVGAIPTDRAPAINNAKSCFFLIVTIPLANLCKIP